jgi:hypothetical protein
MYLQSETGVRRLLVLCMRSSDGSTMSYDEALSQVQCKLQTDFTVPG